MTDASRALVTSPDGQWAAARVDRRLVLMPSAAADASAPRTAIGPLFSPPTANIELASADVDMALVGPPTALVVLSRDPAARSITLYAPPYLEAAARLDLDGDATIAAVSGARVAVVSTDGKHVAIVRSAGRALATQKVEVAGPVDFIVGLERNQLLFGLPKKLEVWDAVSGRPLLRAQFQLPPPPRILGTGAGHLWAMTTGSDEIFLYRLSDGRPFRHYAGAAITDVICHPASPILVLVTSKGLLRLHAYAHSLSLIDGVPPHQGALALHVAGEDISVVGLTALDAEPWRIAINGAGASQPGGAGAAGDGAPTSAASNAGAPASSAGAPASGASASASGAGAPRSSSTAASEPGRSTSSVHGARWREALATFAHEVLRGGDVELPTLAVDNELGSLAQRLGLSQPARRALIVLYALHLAGESISIAALAKLTADWSEPLGQGELAAFAMLRRKHGRVSLRTAVTDILDGAPPRSVRLVGDAATAPRAGAFRVARDSRTDAEIEAALVGQLGRIAVIEGSVDAGLLEALLHGATAIAYSVPPERPRPWPRDAGLVLVLYSTSSAWVADLPTLAPAE